MAEIGNAPAAATDLAGCGAVVNGASSGIGRAIAMRLGRAGMDVWLVGRSREALEGTAATLPAGHAHIAVIDIGRPGSLPT